MKEKMINIRIDGHVKDQIKKLAEKKGRSLSNYIQYILQKVASGEIKVN